MARNGSLALGQVVFEPTAVRVTSVSAQLGGRTQPGEAVMQATSTARQVQLALDASQQTEVAVGNKVSITLPNNQTTPGVVSSVATVATCLRLGRVGLELAAPGTDSCSSGGSGSSTPTIAVDVTPLTRPPPARGIRPRSRSGSPRPACGSALMVPVAALLAQSGGGFAVEVVGAGGRNHLVPVSLGLFDDADGLVQVTGRASPPARKWWSRRHDRHPVTHTRHCRGRGRYRRRLRRFRRRRCSNSTT